MALERLEALAAASIPDLDRVVAPRLRQLGRVVREGPCPDPLAMALERLEAGTPLIPYGWLYCDPPWLFFLKITSYKAAVWTKYKCRHVYLKRAVLYCLNVIHNKQARILK